MTRQKTFWICLVIVFVFCMELAWAHSAKISRIAIANSSGLTRVTFDITGGAFRYQWKFAADTKQLNLTIDNTVLATVLPKAALATTLIKDYQVKSKPGQPLQLQFQLKTAASVKMYTLPASDNRETQLVLELQATAVAHSNKIIPTKPHKVSASAPATTSAKKIVAAAVVPPAPPAVTKVQPKPQAEPDAVNDTQPKIALADKVNGRSIMVVIDPGHGGKDSGAVGPNQVREKDVVLAISKTLQKTFKKQPGFDAELTRYRDVFIPLRERLAIARRCKADIFIAIHADAAYKNEAAMGASVFALSERGATSEGARWLAQKENESELIHGVIVDKDQVLRSVLLDLSQTHTISVSLEMGQSILSKLSAFTKLHYARVEQAAFVVLKSPDIPSLLIETGYISNPIQEGKLQEPAYQQQLANAIVQGVVAYFEQHPPGKRLITT